MSETTEIHVPETMHISGEEEQHPAGERKLSPRDEMMARIAAKAEERRGQEIAQGAIYDAEARERGEALPGEYEPAVEPEPMPEPEEESAPALVVAEPQAPQPTPAPVAPSLHTIQLPDGRIAQVTDEQFAQLAHIGAVAGMAMMQPPAPPPAPVEPPRQSVALDDGKIRETVQRIQFGSPDEGAAALGGLIRDVVAQVPQPQQIDPRILEDNVARRVAAEQQMRADAATIQQEFPAIFADPLKRQEAHAWVEALKLRDQRLNRPRSDLDIYREAGTLVYNQHNLPRPGSEQPAASQAAPTVQPRAGVEERKRAAPRNTQPVDRRAPAPSAPRAPSNSDVVEWMRASRHQASMR